MDCPKRQLHHVSDLSLSWNITMSIEAEEAKQGSYLTNALRGLTKDIKGLVKVIQSLNEALEGQIRCQC